MVKKIVNSERIDATRRMKYVELKFGVLLGLGLCLYTLIAHFLGFYTNNLGAGKIADIAITLLPVILIFVAIHRKRKNEGYLTIRGGIKVGLLTVLISFPISTAFLWIYHHFINPNWLEFILEYERGVLGRQGLGSAEISSRIDALRSGNSDLAQLIGGLVGSVVLGVVLSLIVSVILRRKKAFDNLTERSNRAAETVAT